MRSIVWNSQTSKIPSNIVIGSRLKEIQGWEWKDLNQPVVENVMVVARIRLKKIQIPQQNSLLDQFPSAVKATPVIQITGKIQMKGVQRGMTSKWGTMYMGAAGDFSTQMGWCATGKSESREMGFFPPSSTLSDLQEMKGFNDAFSLVGRQAQPEKEQTEVSSPIKFKAGLNEEKKKHTRAHGKRDSNEKKGKGKLEKNCKGERKE